MSSIIIRRLASASRVALRDPGLAWLAIRSYVFLVLMRAVITVLPLRLITKYLGVPMDETSSEPLGGDVMRAVRRIGWSIRKVSPFTPTNSNCYPQALTARFLLGRRNIPSTVYYGAAFSPTGEELETHVWVRVGPTIVTGAPVHRRFTVVSAFAHAPAKAPRRSRPMKRPETDDPFREDGYSRSHDRGTFELQAGSPGDD